MTSKWKRMTGSASMWNEAISLSYLVAGTTASRLHLRLLSDPTLYHTNSSNEVRVPTFSWNKQCDASFMPQSKFLIWVWLGLNHLGTFARAVKQAQWWSKLMNNNRFQNKVIIQRFFQAKNDTQQGWIQHRSLPKQRICVRSFRRFPITNSVMSVITFLVTTAN